MNMLASTRRTALSFFVGALLLLCCAPWQAVAQIAEPDKGAESKDGQPLQKRVAIRFLTDSDYPPFNYFDEDNVLTGFNVDVARAICLELAAACDIQVRALGRAAAGAAARRGRRRHRLARRDAPTR